VDVSDYLQNKNAKERLSREFSFIVIITSNFILTREILRTVGALGSLRTLFESRTLCGAVAWLVFVTVTILVRREVK
jgi:hypothetical protein